MSKCNTHCRTKSPIHEEFASGIFLHANAAAFIIKSLTESLTLSFDNILLKRFLMLKRKEREILEHYKITRWYSASTASL